MFYKNLVVTTKQKSVIATHTQKGKRNPNAKDSHKSKRREQKKGKIYKNKPQTVNKMAVSASQ